MEFLQGLNDLNNLIGDPGHIRGTLRDIIVFISVITLVINLVQCFFGYKLIKWWISLCGFALFGLIGFCIGYTSHGDTSSGLVWALILGIIGAIIAFTLYKIGIFLIAFASGFLLGWLIIGSVGFGVILGICIGVLALFLLKPVIIISTSVSGAILVGKSLVIILETNESIGTLFAIVLAIGGIVFQWITNTKTSNKIPAQANGQTAGNNNVDNTTEIPNIDDTIEMSNTNNVDDTIVMPNVNTEVMNETIEKAKDTINENVEKAKTTINNGINTADALLNKESEKAIASSKGLNNFEILQEIRSAFYKNKILKPLLFYSDYIAIILCFLTFILVLSKPIWEFEAIITMLFIDILLIIKEKYKLYISINSLNLLAVVITMCGRITYSFSPYFLLLTAFVDYIGIYMFLQTKEGQKLKESFANKSNDTSNNITRKRMSTKAVSKCPKCNTVFSGDDKFCNNCGEKLIPVTATHHCPNCNSIYNEGDKFCNNCGSELTTESNIQ